MNKYKHKIPKDDLKRFAKDLAKKLVNSDYKAGRVDNPTKISEKQQKKVKAYCKDYFDKAAAKHKKHEEERAARKGKKAAAGSSQATPSHSPHHVQDAPMKEEDDEGAKMSGIEDEPPSPTESVETGSLKRKRSTDMDALIKDEDDDLTKSPAKKLNIDAASHLLTPPPPPPPPPAPPADTPPDHNSPEITADHDPDIHADTNFKGKSMADVLAQAQQEGDDEVDWSMDDDEEMKTGFEQQLGRNGVKLANPLVQGQNMVKREKV